MYLRVLRSANPSGMTKNPSPYKANTQPPTPSPSTSPTNIATKAPKSHGSTFNLETVHHYGTEHGSLECKVFRAFSASKSCNWCRFYARCPMNKSMLNTRLTVRPMLAGTRITLIQPINRANRARTTLFTCIRFAFKVADALSAQGYPRSLSFGDWASARVHAHYSVLPRLPDTFCTFARMRARPTKSCSFS